MPTLLTDALLQALKPPATGRIEFRDKVVPGLSLRLTANGVASWAVRGRLPNGQRVRPTLGHWPALGLTSARKQARILIGKISSGTDPTGEKRQATQKREADAREPTVAARLAEWIAIARGPKGKPWSRRYRDEIAWICATRIVPALGSRRLRETSREDWVSFVRRAGKGVPGTASWLYTTISSFLTYAETVGWVDTNPLPRRGKGRVAPAVAPRERALSDDELLRIWRASAQLTPRTRAFTRLLILTAAREDEVARIAAVEIDRAAARWTTPGDRAKNDLPLTVPLHSLALAEIEAVWPPALLGPGYRLLGARPGTGFSGFSKLKAKLDRLSGVTNWRWHDLRRTARTGMTRLGVDRRHAEASLNHVTDRSRLERTYDRHDYGAEVIAALETWQAHVARLIEVATAAA